jgi:hypothetical protein
MFIQDGTGKGYYTQVDQYNRFQTLSITRSNISFHSSNSDSYSIILHHTTINADTPEYIGYLKYLGEKRLFLDSILISSEGNNDQMTSISFIKNPIVSNGIERTPINLNFASSKLLNADIYDSNDTTSMIDVEGGIIFSTIRLKGPTTQYVNLHDSIILEYGNTIAFKCKTENPNILIRINIYAYERTID